MGEDTALLLYALMGAIIGVVLISAIVLAVLKRRQKHRHNFSLDTTGSDRSEIAEILTEKFRNERTRED